MNNLSITITDRRGAIERSVDVHFDLAAANEPTTPAPAAAIASSPAPSVRPRFEKLDASGNITTDTSIPHVAVRDNDLGLEWPVAYVSEDRLSWKAADAAAKACTLFGKNDWRLPTRAELLSLVDDTRSDPAINVDLFPGTKSAWHWTSSPWADSPDGYAWYVNFYDGSADYNGRDSYDFVRAVRSVAAAGQ